MHVWGRRCGVQTQLTDQYPATLCMCAQQGVVLPTRHIPSHPHPPHLCSVCRQITHVGRFAVIRMKHFATRDSVPRYGVCVGERIHVCLRLANTLRARRNPSNNRSV